jgi:thioredoxin-like negative regulator of GroEL
MVFNLDVNPACNHAGRNEISAIPNDAMTTVDHITAHTYQRFINSGSLAMIHLWAKWDNTHLQLQKQIETAISESGLPVQCAMWDTDDQKSLPIFKELGIASVPTVLYYKNGKLVALQTGMRTPAQLKEVFANLNKMPVVSKTLRV